MTPVYDAIRKTEAITKLITLLAQVQPSLEDGEILVLGPGIPREMVRRALDREDDRAAHPDKFWARTQAWLDALEQDLRAAMEPVIQARMVELEDRLRGPLFDAVMDDGDRPEGAAPHA